MPRWRIELQVDWLRAGGEAQALAAAFIAARGQDGTVLVPLPPELAAMPGLGASLPCRFADDDLDEEEFMANLARTGAVTLTGPV